MSGEALFLLKTNQGILIPFVDFSNLSPTSNQSILVGIVPPIPLTGNKTFFIKGMGNKILIKKEKQNFKEFIKTIKFRMETPLDRKIGPKPPTPKSSDLKWEVPKGWVAKPPSGMRLATFISIDSENKSQKAEGSLIILGGDAGGIEANILRWANQLGLSPSSDEVKTLVKKAESGKTRGNLKIQIFDLGGWVSQSNGVSMIITLVFLDHQIGFLKITGPKAYLAKQKNSILLLSRSLHY